MIKSKSNIYFDRLIDNKEITETISDMYDEPVHVLFPQIFSSNINNIKQTFGELELDYQIYFAQKSNKSFALLQQAYKDNINIDVASEQELIDALAAGFTGSRISCTGPKNKRFIILAIKHQCLISIDSLGELNQVVEINKLINNKIDILLRINDLRPKGRNLSVKSSRFGLSRINLLDAYELIKSSTLITLRGFHMHNDGYDIESKIGLILDMVTIFKDSFKYGFAPDIINIGGAWREALVEDNTAWHEYVESLSLSLLNNTTDSIWGNDYYGLHINNKGKIGGKDKALQKAYTSNINNDLKLIFKPNSELHKFVRDNIIKIIIEPGMSLSYNTQLSLIKVIGTKQISSTKRFLLVNANIYNISVAKMFELITDPILITKNTKQEPWDGYIIGNLCREDDFLMKRKVNFNHQPDNNDLIAILNTGAYFSDFEDAQPIKQKSGKRIVAYLKDDKFRIFTDESYNPYFLINNE